MGSSPTLIAKNEYAVCPGGEGGFMGHSYSDDKCVVCGKNLTYGHLTNYCYKHLKEKQASDKVAHWLKTGDTGCGITTTLRNGIRRYIQKQQNDKCAICGMKNKWNNKELKFVLDHIDGDASNNFRNNLRLICPNCDSQLDTFKSKNKHSARNTRRSCTRLGTPCLESTYIWKRMGVRHFTTAPNHLLTE